MFPAGASKELTTRHASVTAYQPKHVTGLQPSLDSPNAAIYSDLAFRSSFPKEPVGSGLQRLQTPIKRTRIDPFDGRLNAAQILG